jgi:hypothetical protein
VKLTDQDLKEFCQIWKEEFDEEISIEEARQHASSLLELYSVLARPLPSELASEENNHSCPDEILPLLP